MRSCASTSSAWRRRSTRTWPPVRRRRRCLRAVDELRARYAPGEPIWRARLAVLARRLSADELYEWFARLKLRRRDADLVADAVAVAPRLPGRARERRPALRGPAPDRAARSARSASRARQSPDTAAAGWLRRYFEELRGVALRIDGGDLAELGLGESPRVGEVLDELLRRKLDGELVGGRSEELDAARELIAAPAGRRR